MRIEKKTCEMLGNSAWDIARAILTVKYIVMI